LARKAGAQGKTKTFTREGDLNNYERGGKFVTGKGESGVAEAREERSPPPGKILTARTLHRRIFTAGISNVEF